MSTNKEIEKGTIYKYLHKWRTSYQLNVLLDYPSIDISLFLYREFKKGNLKRVKANTIAFKNFRKYRSTFAYKISNNKIP